MSEETAKLEAQVLGQAATDIDGIENEAKESFASDENLERESQESTTTPAQPKTATLDTKGSRLLERKSARDDEPYDFERCTVLVLLQLMPLRGGQSSDARKVFVSARTHSYPPQITQMRWDELAPRLPNEIHTLLARLQNELPQRAAQCC